MKTKIVGILLCISMLLSFAVLFSSCKKNEIDFTENYTLIYCDDVSFSMSGDIQNFATALNKKVDATVTTKKVLQGSDVEDESKFEILVGNTNRPQTQEVLEEIEGHGYAIAVCDQKIVIVGTTNFLTCLALDHFADTYLSGEGKLSELTIEKTIVKKEMVELTMNWNFVYSSYLRGTGDYVLDAIRCTKSNIETFSDIRGSAMPVISDAESADKEILVGTVDRAETKTILSGMDATDYAVAMKNGKLVISAFNDSMIEKAFALFEYILNDSIYKSDGSKKQIFLPADFTRIYTDTQSNYITDFPRPQGLALTGTIDVHAGSYEYCYDGEGVNADAYEAYCRDLVAAGYQLHTEHTAAGSVFRTYVNKTRTIMLYVAYNAFASAAAEKTGHKPTIRIVAGDFKKSGMVGEEMLSRASFTKLQASSITAVKANYGQTGKGEMYIVTLEDGSFIVIDGCASDTVITNRIYDVLLDLYKKGHNGNKPNANDPIRIAAWYVTHSHSDHFGAMQRFINNYCTKYSTKYVTIDTLIANFPSDEGYYGIYDDKDANVTVRDSIAEYSAKIQDAPGKEPGMQFIKVHTGQRFWIANVECEVLYTHEDLFPARLLSYNDSSTVMRMTIYHTEDGNTLTEGSKTSVVWLGDVQTEGCAFMRAMYGSYLESDMVQVSHHIGTGSEMKLYRLIKPTWAWFPTDKKSFGGQIGKTSSIGYEICNFLPTLQYVVVSDFCNYTVSITQNGADPAGVCNVGEESTTVAVGFVGKTITTGFLKTRYAN